MWSRARVHQILTLSELSVKPEETNGVAGIDSQWKWCLPAGATNGDKGTKKNSNKKIMLSLYSFPHFTMESDMSITPKTKNFCTMWIVLWRVVRWAKVGAKTHRENRAQQIAIQRMQQVMNKQRDYKAPLPNRLCSHVLYMHAAVFQHRYSSNVKHYQILLFWSHHASPILSPQQGLCGQEVLIGVPLDFHFVGCGFTLTFKGISGP